MLVACTDDDDAAAAPGSAASAAVAVRGACARFYGVDHNINEPGSTPLAPDELSRRCDEPPIEWRADCYAEDVPDTFEPGVGGCAVLGGYLAVRYGDDVVTDGGGAVFDGANGDRWWIVPESD